jgi:CRISPR-associated protein Csm5
VEEDSNEQYYQQKSNFTNRRGHFEDRHLVSRHLGVDPNHDYFRLLRVGDSVFSSTVCTVARTVNLHGRNKWSFRDDLQQYVECIPAGQETKARLSFAGLLERAAISRKISKLSIKSGKKRVYEDYDLYEKDKMEDFKLNKLFHFVNQNTKIIIDNELKFWEEQDDFPAEVDQYLERLRSILQEVSKLTMQRSENQCVLRLGWGSGFRSITGDWQEEKLSNSLYNDLVKSLRPRHSEFLPFPKTRKLDYFGEPFGFLRIRGGG